jgi:hypothetical protein
MLFYLVIKSQLTNSFTDVNNNWNFSFDQKNELLLINQNKSPVAESHLHMRLKHCGEFSKTFPLLGVNFTNISSTYFLPADPKSAKRH